MDRLMNKNIIEGRRDGTSWHNTAKSTGSVVEVNGAVVSRSNAFLPGEILAGQPAGGVSRGRSEKRGHKFARYAGDFIVMVKSARAAERVMASLIRFAEDKLKMVVNRAKSQTAPLKACSFLGFQIGVRGKVVWTAKALACFKQRVREITRRNRGHRVADVI